MVNSVDGFIVSAIFKIKYQIFKFQLYFWRFLVLYDTKQIILVILGR